MIWGVADERDVAATREAFFRRTRVGAGAMYALLLAGGVAAAAAAIARDAVNGAAGAAAGLAIAVVLFAISPRIPVHARVARWLVGLSAFVGIVIANTTDDLFAAPSGLGGCGGLLVGMAAGIAYVRRRLRRDDELLRRQQRLGYDLERPWSWWRLRKR